MTKLRKRVAAVALSAATVAMAAGGITGLRTLSASAAKQEIAPIAKYEFKDAENLGKDSMGNYDMSFRNEWMEGGTGPLLDEGTMIEGGGVEFNGKMCLAQDQANNIFADVTAFTLAFELRTSVSSGAWTHYIGVGNGTHDFAVVSRGGSTEIAGLGVANTNNPNLNTIWGTAILNTTESAFTKIIISAQPGGQLRTWVNGTEFIDTTESKMPAELPESWSPLDENCTFSIGANYNGAAAYPSVGAVKNVVFYDFAMDEEQAAEYNDTGKLVEDVFSEEDLKELLPVAKYEFEDAANPGKDSMGNYNLGLVAKEGGDTSNPWNTGTIEDGVIYMDGTDMLACGAMNDVGDNLNNGFTLNFQYRQDGAQPGAWATPVGFGFNDWSVSTVCSFRVEGGYNHLRVAGHGGVAEGDGNTFYGPVVVQDGTDRMHNVTLSVRPGEKFNVYVDGALAYSTDCPAGWNVSDSNMAFAIGGECVWGNGYNPFKGWIDNISIYNFALSLEQSNAYWEKGKLTVGDMNGEIITSIASTPKFENDEVTNGNLTDRLSDTQAIRRVNPATVDAVFENEETIALNVTWQRLEQDSDGKWYIVGVVDPSDIGYATLLTTAQEVRQEVTVERVARAVSVASGVKNGSVTADKQEAYLGDTVTFTVTPDEGYEIDTVTVNGETLTAGADGKYTYTVEGIEDIEVSATFRAASSQGGGEGNPEGGCNSGCNGSLWGSLGAGSAVIVAAAVISILFIRRKKDNKHE